MNDYFHQILNEYCLKNTNNRDGDNQSKSTPHALFIGLSGKKQSGKDTSAIILKRIFEHNGKRVAITSFSDSLKKMCIEILGLEHEGVYGSDESKNKYTHIRWESFPKEIRLKYSNCYESDHLATPAPRCGLMTNREVLQIVGTEIFRSIDTEVWVKSLFRRDWSMYDIVIIGDCRFLNEKNAVKNSGGIVIRINRNNKTNDNHASETALDNENDFDFICDNNGTLHDLSRSLLNISEIILDNGT